MRRSLCWRGYKTRRSSAELLPADVALQRFKSKFLCRDAKWLQLGFVCTNKIVVCLKKKDKRNLSDFLSFYNLRQKYWDNSIYLLTFDSYAPSSTLVKVVLV